MTLPRTGTGDGKAVIVTARSASSGAALTVKVTMFDVPPPGPGLNTVTFTLPAAAIAVAGMAAVSCVGLTNVVTGALAPKFTAEVETKPVPFTVRVNPAAPAVALVGEMVVIAGTGFTPETTNTAGAEVPPPAGLVTVTLTLPAVAMSEARMAAVSCVALTNVVTRGVPLKLTVAPLTKPAPFTVRVNAPLPAAALVGEMLEIARAGLLREKLSMYPVSVPGPLPKLSNRLVP